MTPAAAPSETARPAATRPTAARRTGGLRTWAPWLAMLAVVVVALGVGTFTGSPPSDAERAQALEGTIRCPSCTGQSVSNSVSPSAKAVKLLVRERIAAGDSDEEIRDFVASRYGRDVLLDPSGKGFGALVWGVPVAVAIIAVGALVLRFGDWRPGALPVTDADRDLVADALGAHDGTNDDAGPTAGVDADADADAPAPAPAP